MTATPLIPRIPTVRLAAALAADPTVAQAAVEAVEDAIVGLDIVEGGDFLPDFNDDLVFAVVDGDGQRTWMEVGPDGGLSEHAAARIGEHIAGAVEMDTDVTGFAFAVVDEDGQLTDLELGPDGKFTDRVVASLGERITGSAAAAELDWVVCSGDSMTASGYPPDLQALEPDWTVVNVGVGGETSTTIAGRMGGRPMLVAVAGAAIPASGGVTVTLTSDDGEHAPTPLLQAGGGVNPVRIEGIEGTLTQSSGTYTFTRSLAGSEVPVVGLRPLITQGYRDYRSGIHVFWWGTNDNAADAVNLIGRIKAQLLHVTDARPRFLVIGMTASANRATANAQLLREFGRRFIDLLAYLKSDAAFTDAGVTKTAQDTTDIGNNVVPTSFRSDATHLNPAGRALTAVQVQRRILEMGWLDGS